MIGKEPLVFFLVLSLIFVLRSSCAAEITLRLLDARNVPSATVACNERCRLEIKVTGMGKQGGAWPHIAGVAPDMIVGRQQRSEVSWIQGKQDAAHYFTVDVVFPKVGLLNIGPATYLDGDGKKLTSNGITCTVTDLPATKVRAREQQSYFLKWELQKEKLYVDEAISVVLSLYATDNSVHLEAMSEINVKDAEFSLLPEVHQRSAVHNGNIYKVFSWHGILCPSRAGILELPRVTVQFATGAQHIASPWRLMQQFFDSTLAPQQVHAPAISMTVHAVPPTEHEIIGVGVIHTIQQTLDRHEVQAGEALVLTRKICGTYAPTRLKNSVPPYSGVPIKMYESGIKTVGSYPEIVTEQECIFQATAAGDLIIPEQVFWFFNTEHEAYERIVVPADRCVVSPGVVQALNPDPVAPALPTAPEEQRRVLPRAQRKPGISLVIFVLLILLPLIFLMLRRFLYSAWLVVYNRLWIILCMYRAKKGLRGVLQETDDKVGYSVLTLMQNFIIHVIGQARDNSLKLVVRSWLVQHGAEETLINRWVSFWDTLEHLAFSTDVVQNKAELVQHSYFWINSIGSMARKRLT